MALTDCRPFCILGSKFRTILTSCHSKAAEGGNLVNFIKILRSYIVFSPGCMRFLVRRGLAIDKNFFLLIKLYPPSYFGNKILYDFV